MIKRQSQAELLKKISNKELIYSLYISQQFFLVLAILLAYILFDSYNEFFSLFVFDWEEIVLLGVVPGIIVVAIDIFLIKILPKSAYDDGGINQRIFTSLNIPQIFILSIIVAVSEEMLFRGILHTFLGFIIASTIFALIHFRYLNKIALLISIFLLSFLIGYMYELTNNLLVPIAAHFCIDFLLGSYYRMFMR